MNRKEEGQRIGISGNSGSGKTFLTQHITKDSERLIVVDPKHTYQNRARELNYYVTSDMADFLDVLRDNWDTGFRIVYEPMLHNVVADLNDICQLLIHLQAPYKNGAFDKMLDLIVEEVQTAAPNPLGNVGKQFMYAVSMLRESGVNIYGATNLPQKVATDFRDLLSRQIFMKPAGIRAATVMADGASGETDLRDAILNLEKHHYIIYVDGKWSEKPPVTA